MSGLEFCTHSASTKAVKSSSYVNYAFFKIFLRKSLTQQIMRLKLPPHHGTNSKRDDENLAAVLKVWALPDTTSFGIPRLQMKRLKLLMNVSMLRSQVQHQD